MKNILIALTLIIGVNYSFAQTAQQGTRISIEDIFDNPGRFENEVVTVEGIVTQYVMGTTQTTSFYTVQSSYGSIITVNTSAESPKVMKKYRISGVVVIDQSSRRPIIIEQSRKIIDPLDKLLPYLIGLVVLLIIFLIIYMLVNRKGTEKSSGDSAGQSGPSGEPSASGGGKSSGTDTDYETIRISKESPKTVKIIPGKFEIISGADKGKSFMISGLPTRDGVIVTLGRSRNSNIQFFEKTVSRQQAELIYVNGKLFVKNLSHTNNTQVNGVEMDVDETRELPFGSVIKTGEVELLYHE
jgi:hypothetical protein